MKIYRVVTIILLILLTTIVVIQFNNSKNDKSEIKRLESVNKDLKVLYQNSLKVSDSLSKIKNKTIIEYKTIVKYIKQQQNETDSIVDSVGDLDEQQLDSTIRAYKHIKRK